MEHMKKWGDKVNIEVDTTVYFSDKMMKQLISLTMVVGGHGAQFEYCELSNSVLACMAEDKSEKAERTKKDQARELTTRTRTYREELNLGKADSHHLPDTFEEARLCAGTRAEHGGPRTCERTLRATLKMCQRIQYLQDNISRQRD